MEMEWLTAWNILLLLKVFLLKNQEQKTKDIEGGKTFAHPEFYQTV